MRWSGSVLALLVAAAVASGCAVRDPAALSPEDATIPAAAARLAVDLDEADAVVGRSVAQLDQFARRNRREAAAIAYATGARAAVPQAGEPAAAAAGDVLEPAFEAFAIHGRRLASMVDRPPPGPPPPDPAALRAEAAAGLDAYQAATRRPVPAGVREAGLAAIATLAAPPEAGTAFADFVAGRQGAVEALAALVRHVVGADNRSGLRAVLEAERLAASRAQAALMAAAQRDRSVGVMDRYALYHAAMDAEAEHPAAEVLEEMIRVLDALPPAHASLAQGDAAAAAQRVLAFSAAVDRLEAAESRIRPGSP
jgi:hypothetical protein